MHPATMERGADEGLLCGLADAVDALRDQGLPVHRVLLLGGGARSRAVQALAPALLGAEGVLPEPAEDVAPGPPALAAARWPPRTPPTAAPAAPPAKPPGPSPARPPRPPGK